MAVSSVNGSIRAIQRGILLIGLVALAFCNGPNETYWKIEIEPGKPDGLLRITGDGKQHFLGVTCTDESLDDGSFRRTCDSGWIGVCRRTDISPTTYKLFCVDDVYEGESMYHMIDEEEYIRIAKKLISG